MPYVHPYKYQYIKRENRMSNFSLIRIAFYLRVGLGASVRLLHCDLDITGSSYGNSLSACRGKVAYI